ncbi:hypothetical protein B0J11DRAFT_319820 [Dendryphion nanum]|uniref:Uncharacterized protein n=1 Tax=Dendryphion nanum TaxID=256645 RepID=A0A9P9DRG3_9PLEO|nr:hypothetical protein B0J11DRAFT_319820 [Dendryphion nanum]
MPAFLHRPLPRQVRICANLTGPIPDTTKPSPTWLRLIYPFSPRACAYCSRTLPVRTAAYFFFWVLLGTVCISKHSDAQPSTSTSLLLSPVTAGPILLGFEQPTKNNTSNVQQDDDMSAMNGTTFTKEATTPSPSKFSMPLYTTPRNVSGPLAVESTNAAADQNTAASPWLRSNPHATPGNSKTSQYIDKITSENERLRRELRAEKLAREDETKRLSAARTKAEDSRAEYQHLQVLADANARAIERKDRKLEELKATLETEAKRRQVAEQRAEEALKMLGDTRSETQRQLAAAYEQKHLAETNTEAAREGYKRITDGYEKKLKVINEQLHELRKNRIEDADKIKRQAIISEQMQHEVTRTLRNEDKMTDMMGTYRKEHRKEMDRLIQEAEKIRMTLPEKEKEATKLVTEMKDTRDKMKWVMSQKQRQG